ncbi:MAG: cytochrome c biogenesis protein CcsA [Bacteroidales bacterium]|jgi:ABC-type transport system involved in cytochrome c biogenesis permease subunit|nr:cytochrome c biogenesis protein CcsA [Bacteroidales bacterium]
MQKIKNLTILFLVLILIIFAGFRVFVEKNLTMQIFNAMPVNNSIAFEDKTGDAYQLPFEVKTDGLAVNQPINYKGYSIYLQDISNYAFTLKIVYDPFRIPTGVILTLLLILLTTTVFCEIRKMPLYFNIPIVVIFLTSTILLWLKMRHGNVMPALKSWYFPFHVGVYITAYICAIATWMTALLNQRKNVEIQHAAALLKTTNALLAIGMILGSLWAKQCWGNFWTWDIKETCALITLIMFVLSMIPSFLRIQESYRNRLTFILLTLAVLAMLFTWKGIDLLPESITSLHRY